MTKNRTRLARWTAIAASAVALAAVPAVTTAAHAQPAAYGGLPAPVSAHSAYMVMTSPSSAAISTKAALSPLTYTGVCLSGVNRCWRQNPGITGSSATDIWPRDIGGDSLQRYKVLYYGQANGGGKTYCPEFGAYNVGVFAFIDNNGNGYPISAGYYSGGVYHVGEGANASQYWIWNSNGVIENCWDSRSGNAFTLQAGANYTQLWTSTNPVGPVWQQIHV